MTPLSEKDLLRRLERNPHNIRFEKLRQLCEQHFGSPRQSASHLIFRTPWPNDPFINIQSDQGKAKPYQVRQVVRAIQRLKKID
jgi:hypothetical protein